MCEPYVFKPSGNDLRKVMYYHGIPLDDQITCPFHDDNRPSCHIDYESGTFYCFACGVSGDAFEFVKLAYPKLNGIKQLQRYFRILKSKKVKPLKNDNFRASKKRQDKLKNKQYYEDISHDYYYGLKTLDWKKEKGPEQQYLKARGFNSKTMNEFGVKLTVTSKAYPIIFPIFDMGNFAGYVCRTMNKNVEKRAKYLYNTGFSRNHTLGGYYKNEVVVLCEGYLDMIKLRQFGLTNVACIFGWKITSKQVDKLKAMGVKTIISALDTDLPGRKGTDYLKNFFNVIRFQFPNGIKDPGELTQELFDTAYKQTKQLYRKMEMSANVNSKQHKTGNQKQRSKQVKNSLHKGRRQSKDPFLEGRGARHRTNNPRQLRKQRQSNMS